jgi:hypothetical protein
MKSYLEEIVAAPVYKAENTAVGSRCTDHPLSAEVGTNFADEWRSLGIVRSRTKATEFVVCYTLNYRFTLCLIFLHL